VGIRHQPITKMQIRDAKCKMQNFDQRRLCKAGQTVFCAPFGAACVERQHWRTHSDHLGRPRHEDAPCRPFQGGLSEQGNHLKRGIPRSASLLGPQGLGQGVRGLSGGVGNLHELYGCMGPGGGPLVLRITGQQLALR